MKRNAALLTLASLVIGALITLGLTRATTGVNLSFENCSYATPNSSLVNYNGQIGSIADCGAVQKGYPLNYLHSHVWVVSGNDAKGHVSSEPWIEFKPATVDWLIWSVVSAVGIGLLIYLLERAGLATGFAEKKRRR